MRGCMLHDQIAKWKNIISVCSFYRPPASSTTVMTDSSKTLETLYTDYLVIGGDFNILELLWNDPSSSVGAIYAAAWEMLDIFNSFSLTRMVKQSTRQNDILDFFF